MGCLVPDRRGYRGPGYRPAGMGHTTYLWVQGAEASAAAVLLLAFSLRFRHYDPRTSRWPPLLPLAAIAATGAAKDFFVAWEADTPEWLAALLLASVVWFLIASWLMWRAERRMKVAGRAIRTLKTANEEHAMRPLRYSINVTLDGCCDHHAV